MTNRQVRIAEQRFLEVAPAVSVYRDELLRGVPLPMLRRGLAAVAGSWALEGFGMFSVIERDRGTVDRPGRTLGAGRMARPRDRLRLDPRRLGQGLRLVSDGRVDRLGGRPSGMGRIHPRHQPRKHGVDRAGAQTGVERPRPWSSASALGERPGPHLGTDRRGVARPPRALTKAFREDHLARGSNTPTGGHCDRRYTSTPPS